MYLTNKEKIESIISGIFDNIVERVVSLSEIPKNQYMVYILFYNDKPIVLGKGKYNRSKVIFDDLNRTTPHVKSLKVKLYHLYGDGNFERYIIRCKDDKQSKLIEKQLHDVIGGNTLKVSDDIKSKLLLGLKENDIIYKFLSIALLSSYDGISDLIRWKKANIINETEWKEIKTRLNLK